MATSTTVMIVSTTEQQKISAALVNLIAPAVVNSWFATVGAATYFFPGAITNQGTPDQVNAIIAFAQYILTH